jgi:two-component sensor histidine kinase
MQIATTETDGQFALREASHRFLNTLTVLSLALRSDFGDPAVRDAVGVFSSRIHAFAGVHRMLGDLPAEGMVDASSQLARLCEELCIAHLAPRGLRCEFSSDPGLLPREVYQALGLVVVELVTNAAKHAFVGRPSGLIRVSLLRAEAAWICQVADNGSGLRSGPGAVLHIDSGSGGVTASLMLPHDPLAGVAGR